MTKVTMESNERFRWASGKMMDMFFDTNIPTELRDTAQGVTYPTSHCAAILLQNMKRETGDIGSANVIPVLYNGAILVVTNQEAREYELSESPVKWF